MAGPISISILADARDAIRGFRNTSGEAQTMGKKVKGAASAMAGPALGALGGIGAAAFAAAQKASELGDSFDANKIIFGEATKDIQAFADTAAKSMGLSKQAVVDASNSIGTFGAAAGLKGSNLSKFTTDLVKRGADVASMFGGTAAEATEAFGGALRGEFEGVRKYGVLLDDSAIKAQAMSMGLVKASGNVDQIKAANVAAQMAQQGVNDAIKKFGPSSLQAQKAQVGLTAAQTKLKSATAGVVPELTAQQKTLAVQGALLAATTKADNNYIDTIKSAKNQQQSLTATLDDTTATMGTDLLPALSGIVGVLSGMASWVGRNAATAKILIGVVAGLAVGILAVNLAIKAAAAAQAVWTGAVAAWGVVTKVGTAIQAAFNFVMAMNPIGLVIIAIVALVAIFVVAYKKSETFRRIVDAAFQGIKSTAVAVFEFLKKYIGIAIAFVVTTFKKGVAMFIGAWNFIFDIVKTVMAFRDKVIGIVLGLVGRFLGLGKNIMQGLADGIGAGLKWVRDKVSGLGDMIPDWLKDVLGIASPSKVMAGIGKDTMRGLNAGLESQLPAIRTTLGKVTKATTAVTNPARKTTLGGTGIVAAAQELLRHIRAGGTVFEDLSFKGASANMKRFNDQLADMAGSAGGNLGALKRFLTGLVAPVAKRKAATPAAAAVKAGTGIVAAAQELLRHIRSGGTVFEDLSFRGMSANMKKFNDQLADRVPGGGKSRATLIHFLETLRAPAAVAKARPAAVATARPAARAGLAVSMNVTVSPLADPADTGREISKALNAFARSRGLSPVVSAVV